MHRTRAHYPLPSDVNEVLRQLEADEERRNIALKNYWELNSRPAKHDVRLTGKQITWLIFGCLIICAVGIGLLVRSFQP